MHIGQLCDRFGSNRTNSEKPGKLLAGCTCIAVPFAGGMSEVLHMPDKAIINVNDADRHVINLANVVKYKREWLTARLAETLLHPVELSEAQAFCRHVENGGDVQKPYDLEWAAAYFVCSWMSRGGTMGTDGQFDQSMSVRWKGGGGNTAVRFRSAADGLAEWGKVAQRCNFTCMDAFEMLAECLKRDVAENGIYLDPPWPDDGDKYTHKFNEEAQRCLAAKLNQFKNTRIVIRYGVHPLIEELYPRKRWHWTEASGRTKGNSDKAEVLIANFK